MAGRDAKPEPVFVVGMNGSGTTMLLDSLGRHPQLYAFPRETRLIPHLIATQARYGDLSQDENFRSLWNAVRSLGAFEQTNGYCKVPLPDDWRTYPRNLAAVLDGVFRYFAAREGKRRWCEKTPQHVQHIVTLAELFPAARFVHVIRDGRDCAASFHRRWHRTPELTLYRWKKVVLEGRRQGSRLGADRYLEMRYEDLTTDPEGRLDQVCRFLDLAFDSAVLVSAQPFLSSRDLRSDDTRLGRLTPNSGNWKRHFSAGRIARLERIGATALQSMGYDAAIAESDYDPSPLRRRLWSSRDALVQYAREISLKLGGRIERPWRLILSRPFAAYRARKENRY